MPIFTGSGLYDIGSILPRVWESLVRAINAVVGQRKETGPPLEKPDSGNVLYRRAARDDLEGIAQVLLAAFPESVDHYVGRRVEPRVIVDVFSICFDAEPEALFVAAADGKIVGYIFAPTRLSRIFRAAIFHGHLAQGLWRWVTGQYGIGTRPVFVAARNWISVWNEARKDKLHVDARILTIAVDPAYQGRGVGSELMKLGLDYLQSRTVELVRLEVRPDNPAAIHVYQKLGFEIKGRTRDTQGDWLIMIKDLSRHAEA
jgi:ribosomal protein S18 acetylase RimI-like enzyme